jgi:hypothetical protein
MSHTPGPWKLDDFGRYDASLLTGDYHAVSAGNGYHADGENGTGFGLTGFLEMEDARLIAAAPQLLEACKAVLIAFERNDCIDWNILSVAIAKAEGK